MDAADSKTGRENTVLNILRSVAAILVVAGHVRLLFFDDQSSRSVPQALFYTFTSLGSPAVIVFFVLSGYWVGGNALRSLRLGTFTWAGYATSRLTRLWLVLVPALLVTTTADLVGRHLFSGADIYSRTSLYDGVPPFFDHSLPSFFGTAMFVGGLHVQLFGSDMPLWSLAYEFWYYAMFPAALVALVFARDRTQRVVAAIAFLCCAAIAGVGVLELFPAWLAGAAVAWRRERIVELLRRAPRQARFGLQVLLGVATLAMVLAARQGSLDSIDGKLALAVVAAAWISVLTEDAGRTGIVGRVLAGASRTAHFSYSLYAIHMPIVVFIAALVLPRFTQRWTLSWSTSIAFVGILVALLLASAAFARATEHRTDHVRARVRTLLRRPIFGCRRGLHAPAAVQGAIGSGDSFYRDSSRPAGS